MDSKEQNLRAELAELENKLQDSDVFSDKNYPRIAKRKAELDEIMALFDERAKLDADKAAAEELAQSGEADMAEMANQELDQLATQIADNEERLLEAL